MTLRFRCWILLCYFMFLTCGRTNGVRYVVKQLKKTKPYITGYIDAKETNQQTGPYITGYIDAKETNQQTYKTGYGDSQETKQRYITSYINNADDEETKQTYITGYIADHKEMSQPYITGYIGDDKDTKRPNYITQYGGDKEMKQPNHITQYGSDRESEQPNYMTGYRGGGDKEMKQPNYVTQYGGGGDKEKEQSNYITQYRVDKEMNQPPGTENEEGKESVSKCRNHMHVHSVSQNGVLPQESVMRHVHNHMKTQPSMSHGNKDHIEAFKIGFFTPDDLGVENIMPLHFPIQQHSRFLPKQVADSIPFSKSQLLQVLQLFAIPQGSSEAKDMEQTLRDCSLRPITGEIKLCATSLESMVDFTSEIIGPGIEFDLLSTTHPTISKAFTQNYTILEVPKEVVAPKMVFCHPVPYPYAVFFCHYFGTETKVFKVSLGGENGDKVKAIAVCHMDTSDWDPKHMLFRLLRTKPGVNSPVCHFLPANHLVWTPSTKTVTI
nr:BURP domain-containing protein 3-like [Ziziphus jujuba var. spinosa]